MTVPKGSIIGIIGGNGAGKSTLFKMITGIEKPDKGEIKIGETVKIAYVEQLRDEMDNNHSVWESYQMATSNLTEGMKFQSPLVDLTSKAPTSKSWGIIRR